MQTQPTNRILLAKLAALGAALPALVFAYASAPDGDQPVVAQVSGIQSPSKVYLSVQR